MNKAIIAAIGLLGAVSMGARAETPQFKVDPYWPKPFPNNWTIGEIGGLTVDDQDNVWLIHRPGTLTARETRAGHNPPYAPCCAAAPPVIALDKAGNVVHAWGGPGQGFDWPNSEHGVAVDPKGNVWILGNGNGTRQTQAGNRGRGPAETAGPQGNPDGMAIKFSKDGKFLMQIGHRDPPKGSLDINQFNKAAKVVFDAAANEAFFADGYGNRRIIVFDMDTGKFKRMWGAYGNKPNDDPVQTSDAVHPDKTKPLPQQFNTVHCVAIAKDGLIYVCDRQNNRIQVFKKDGTFVSEFIYPGSSFGGTPGRVADMVIWPDKGQSYIIIDDGNYEMVRIVDRFTGDPVTSFGRPGNYAGQFNRLHAIAVDSDGSIFAGEAGSHRVQKFLAIVGAPTK